MKFAPILKVDCRETATSNTPNCVHNRPNLPRLDNWLYNDLWLERKHEGKLHLRSQAVSNFYVHYVTQVKSATNWSENNNLIFVNRSQIVLSHYKRQRMMTFFKFSKNRTGETAHLLPPFPVTEKRSLCASFGACGEPIHDRSISFKINTA